MLYSFNCSTKQKNLLEIYSVDAQQFWICCSRSKRTSATITTRRNEQRQCAVCVLVVAIYFNSCHFILRLIDVNEQHEIWIWRAGKAGDQFFGEMVEIGYLFGCGGMFFCLSFVVFGSRTLSIIVLGFYSRAISFYLAMHMLICDMWYNLLLLPVLLHFSSWLNFGNILCMRARVRANDKKTSAKCIYIIYIYTYDMSTEKRERQRANRMGTKL